MQSLKTKLKYSGEILSFKWIYRQFGLSPETVFLRALLITATPAALIAAAHYFFPSTILIDGKDDFKINLTGILALLGSFWTVHHALHMTFISKYSYLNSEFSKLPADEFLPCNNEGKTHLPEFHISNDLLNFGDTCALYNLTENSDFSHTFDELVAHLMEIKHKTPLFLQDVKFAFPMLYKSLDKKSAHKAWNQLENFKSHRKTWNEWEALRSDHSNESNDQSMNPREA
jgi:hypothetical protein